MNNTEMEALYEKTDRFSSPPHASNECHWLRHGSLSVRTSVSQTERKTECVCVFVNM